MSGRPRKACQQCNSQKVRCSGQRPMCQRCVRLGRSCIYETEHLRHTLSPHPQFAFPPEAGRRQLPYSNYATPSVPPTANIPSDLLVALIPLYFSHIYNASLLLHRPTFEPSAIVGFEKPQVVLSVCAFASRFYRDANHNPILDEQQYSREWANQAARFALAEIEDPHEGNLVTFINLALFWYSLGEWRKSFVYKTNAMCTAHILGLSFEPKGRQPAFGSEVRRRRYWACHCINSFTSDTLFPSSGSAHVNNLRLPCRDDDYEAGVVPDGPTLSTGVSNGSIYAELIKALNFWTKTSDLIRNPDLTDVARVSAIHALDALIAEWWSQIPEDLQLQPSSMFLKPQESLPRVLLIHIIYHQSLCALHSSIVPLFSMSPNAPQWSHACQLSAQVAFEHANIASSFFTAALKHSWDASRIPSFVAYAAYGACSIQIPFIWCAESQVRESARTNVAANIEMIRHLKKYWKFAALLDTNARKLYEVHSRSPHLLDNQPKLMDAQKFNVLTGNAGRARLSVLTHNAILNDNGVVAKDEQDVDSGITEASLECVTAVKPNTATSLETELFGMVSDSDRPLITPSLSGLQQQPDTFQPFLDPALFVSDLSSFPLDMDFYNEDFTEMTTFNS